MRQRPIFGGVFGHGRYSLASMPCLSRGLHAVRYMVIEPGAGAVLSVSEDKLDALATARKLLRAAKTIAQQQVPLTEQHALWPSDETPPSVAGVARRPVSKRRRELFEKSEGKCHYCRGALTLDGKWHVEHMMPRALGGEDELGNLVASCVACNLAKRDKTAIEFVSQLPQAAPQRPRDEAA